LFPRTERFWVFSNLKAMFFLQKGNNSIHLINFVFFFGVLTSLTLHVDFGKKHEKKPPFVEGHGGFVPWRFFPQIAPSGVDSWISNFGEVANSRAGETQIGK